MRQFLLPGTDDAPAPATGAEVVLSPEESRHLVRVLRARPGTRIGLTDGRGHRFTGELLVADPAAARVVVRSRDEDAEELAAPRLVLACGVIREQRFEWALEKAVELGAHEIVPLLTAHGEIVPRQGKRRRWEAHVTAALKQSDRAWRPVLHAPVPLADWLARREPQPLLFGLARLRRAATAGEGLEADALAEILPRRAPWSGAGAWTLVVGPEGGWRDDEVALLARHGTPLRLGVHRLRTETAAIAGLALLAAARQRLLAGRA